MLTPFIKCKLYNWLDDTKGTVPDEPLHDNRGGKAREVGLKMDKGKINKH